MKEKTKKQLLDELEAVKERLIRLENADIERQKVIEALSESEAKYRLLFDVAPVGIGIADLNGKIIDANKSMQEMGGYSLEEYRAIGVGATYADPEERKLLLKSLREKGNVRDWEGRLKRKDGTEYYALLNADIMELGGQKLLLAIIRDISQSKRNEAKLNGALAKAQEEKNKSEAIISALGDGLIIQDTDYKIIYQNQVQNEIYGDKTGELCYKAYEGRDQICEDCPVERTFRDGKIHRSERRFNTDKGDLYFELTSSPLKDSNGNIIAGIKVVREITGQKRLEQTLRESEEKYRRLVETLTEGIWVLDKDANTTFVNPRMAQMLGYNIDEMLGKHLFSFMDEQWMEKAKRYLKRRQQGVKEHHEFEFIRKDGTRIYTSLETSPFTDEKENYSGAVAAIADITERKRDEYEKNRLLKAIASSTDGITICDEKDRYIYVNAAYARIYGYSQEDFTGETWRKVTPSDLIPGVEKGLEDTLYNKDSGVYKGEVPGLRKDGGIVPTEVMATSLWDENGNYDGHICIVRDITERKRAEEKLREGERFLETIFASIQDGIGIIDKDMNIIGVNKTAERWYPHAVPIIGKKCYEAYHKRKERCEICPASETLKTGKSAYNVVPKHGPGGKEVGWLEIYSYPLIDKTTGSMKGIIEYVRDITERKRVEEELKQSEEKYRLLIENIQEGVFVIQDAKMVFVNQEFAKITGYSIEESIGMDFSKFVAPEDLEMVKDRYYRRQEGKNVPKEYEFHVLHKNGEKPVVNMNVGIVTYRGRVASMGILRDITVKKRAEDSLKLFSETVKNAPDGVQIVDTDGQIIYSNMAVEEMFGFTNDELIGKNVGDMNVDPEIAGKVIIPGILETGGWTGELMVKHMDGHEFPIWLKTSIVKDAKGVPIAMVGILRDITERKKVEKALLESETRYRTLFESAIDAIFILEAQGEEGRIVAANRTAAKMHGYSIEELLAMKIDDFDTPESLHDSMDFITRILKGETIKAELDHHRKDGTIFPVEINAGLLELGGHKYILAFDRDITERKNAEEAIRKYNLKLEESNRMKELFTDIMHHDLLNPLNVAHGYVELFLEDEKNPRKKSHLDIIKRNLVKGMELIDNATKFSKLESMDYIEFEDLDLKIVIGEAIANLIPLAASAGMTIENKLKGSMPARANKIIEDVFINIISNAIKYAPEGKKIVVEGKASGKSWSVSVKDFGAGIKDAQKTLIFERFHREEKKGVKGSGLGLAIAGKIVELHKGRIMVEDNPEGGAVFVVKIPKS
ncbi:MAG: PAS domain S-box protein [Candidatus Methanoperedens sp.]